MTVDNQVDRKVVDYLGQLGLTTDQVSVYLYLLQHGPHTVLALSRGLKTGRTKLYPLLDELADKQLVTVRERHYGTDYEAGSPATLEFLVNGQEQSVQAARKGLPAALHSLQMLQKSSPATAQLIEYRGLDGIKQIHWNLNKAKTGLRILEVPAISKQIGKHLTDKLHQEVRERSNLHIQVLSNKKNPVVPCHYLDPKLFAIEFETYIYNNTVALVAYEKTAFYGIEIHSRHLSRQYIQLFDLLWQQRTTQ
jgi:sugar-specific transcriptional regulator TrmB